MQSSRPIFAPIALTMGDPAGIGPEICLKAAAAWQAPCQILGDTRFLANEAQRLGITLPTNVSFLHATTVGPDMQRGQISAGAGQNALDCIEHAVELALSGQISAIVTAPIHKEAIHAAGSPYPGHTEMLAALAGLQEHDIAMMLVNDQLRTLLVSIHLSLRQAIEQVTQESVLRAIRLSHQALRRAGVPTPRIAVAGLNPHAGEAGLFGDEEQRFIQPAIEAARAEGIQASGPYPPDTIFMRARGFQEFDIVVAQYHDQGLIPIKYLGLDEGVNVTVGLPFVRTSVDHGTAFDLAGKMKDGKGLANEASLLAAMRVATEMTAAG